MGVKFFFFLPCRFWLSNLGHHGGGGADNDDYSRSKLAPLELDVVNSISLQPQYLGKENRGIKRHPRYTARHYLRKAKNET